ncbi:MULTISPECIES: hypothetical protein [Enterobacter cloacae complex]|uniref:hypothetical protein n=1 Tax=Enterobacter cloacae complex TaxID=354276 RepID=UPI0023AFBFD7|nr:hypothetical protein [Enterobacter hormaechei]MDE7626044.1 hypothetical protein [Enterobacter hormaechei]
MSKHNEKNIWKRNGLAPLEYCPISRAAKILECETDDIFHWCYTGKINLCINFQMLYYFYTPFLKSDGNVFEQVQSLNSELTTSEDNKSYIYSDKFKSGRFHIPDNFHFVETDEYYLVQAYLRGIWPVDRNILSAINTGFIDPIELCLFSEENPEFKPDGDRFQLISPILINNQFPGKLKNEAEFDIKYLQYLSDNAPDINDKNYQLQITGYYIEYINKHALSGIHMPVISKDKDARTLTSYQTTEIPKIRTTAKQSTYIASLMNALEVTEEMMRFSSITQIKDHLSRKAGPEMEFPEITDDTLDDWLQRAGKR